MKKIGQALTLSCILAMPLGVDCQAQVINSQHAAISRLRQSVSGFHEAQQMVDDGHYYAASVSLKAMKEGTDFNSSERCQWEGLQLICDYFMLKDGTGEAINEWLNQAHTGHEASAMANRIKVLGANLKVREGRYSEALNTYAATDLSSLSRNEYEEALTCRAVANLAEIDSHEMEADPQLRAQRLADAEAVLLSLQGCKSHQMDWVYYSGYLKYVKGEYENAIEDFNIVKDESDYSNSATVYLADCYLHTGNQQKALSLLNNQLPLKVLNQREQFSDDRYADESNRIKGEAYYDQKNYTKAIEALQKYCYNTENPRRTALYKLGMSLFNIQEYKSAAPALSQSASTATDAMAQSAWLNAGICYIHSGNKKSAQIAFQQASEMEASQQLQEEALYNYALTLHEGHTMGFGESVGVFEKFLNKFPNSQYASSVSKHLTEVYFTTKNYKAALESINKIKNPSADIRKAKQKVLYNLGVQEFEAGNYQRSDAYAQQSIQLGSIEALFLKGEGEYRQGKYSQATADLKKYVNSSSRGLNYNQALYSLGYSLFKQKQYGNAKGYFGKFVDGQKEGVSKLQLADALNRYADCMYSDRNYDDAYAIYQRAMDTDESAAGYATYQQAFIEGLRGNYKKKVELLDNLTTSQPTAQTGNQQIQADALFEQGRAYVQTGDKQKALNTFTLLNQRFSDSPKGRQALNEMAMLYSETGNDEKAVSLYKKVINDYPNTMDAQTALANLKNIYMKQGQVDEYTALAAKVGKNLSQQELDQMISDAAENAMDNGNYEQAYKYYDKLSQQAQTAASIDFALEGKLRSSFTLKDYDANIKAANQILMTPTASANLRDMALLFRAESYLAKNNAVDGVKDLQALAAKPQTLYGAQGNVRLAQYAYDTQQYQAAEQLLTKFIDSGTPQQYWLARGFILLSDVYDKTDRKVEAKEYLLSLKSNYSENEEINKMIATRLEKY